jgi:hypothetical protein
VSPCFLVYHLTECGADEIGQGYIAEQGIEAVLKRLDRFIENEARSTAAQTLQLVYGLVQNVKILVDGKQISFALTFGIPDVLHIRLQGI